MPARSRADLALSSVVKAHLRRRGGRGRPAARSRSATCSQGPTGKTVAACSSSPVVELVLPVGRHAKPGTRQLLAVFNPFPSEAVRGRSASRPTTAPGRRRSSRPWSCPGNRSPMLDVVRRGHPAHPDRHHRHGAVGAGDRRPDPGRPTARNGTVTVAGGHARGAAGRADVVVRRRSRRRGRVHHDGGAEPVGRRRRRAAADPARRCRHQRVGRSRSSSRSRAHQYARGGRERRRTGAPGGRLHRGGRVHRTASPSWPTAPSTPARRRHRWA